MENCHFFSLFGCPFFQSHFKNVIALAVHIAADQGGSTNKNAEKMFTKKGGCIQTSKALELLLFYLSCLLWCQCFLN